MQNNSLEYEYIYLIRNTLSEELFQIKMMWDESKDSKGPIHEGAYLGGLTSSNNPILIWLSVSPYHD